MPLTISIRPSKFEQPTVLNLSIVRMHTSGPAPRSPEFPPLLSTGFMHGPVLPEPALPAVPAPAVPEPAVPLPALETPPAPELVPELPPKDEPAPPEAPPALELPAVPLPAVPPATPALPPNAVPVPPKLLVEPLAEDDVPAVTEPSPPAGFVVVSPPIASVPPDSPAGVPPFVAVAHATNEPKITSVPRPCHFLMGLRAHCR